MRHRAGRRMGKNCDRCRKAINYFTLYILLLFINSNTLLCAWVIGSGIAWTHGHPFPCCIRSDGRVLRQFGASRVSAGQNEAVSSKNIALNRHNGENSILGVSRGRII